MLIGIPFFFLKTGWSLTYILQKWDILITNYVWFSLTFFASNWGKRNQVYTKLRYGVGAFFPSLISWSYIKFHIWSLLRAPCLILRTKSGEPELGTHMYDVNNLPNYKDKNNGFEFNIVIRLLRHAITIFDYLI
jgi:hypothetical protein